MLTASYSVNGKPIKAEELKDIQITKKDYIDYVEAIIKNRNNFQKAQKK